MKSEAMMWWLLSWAGEHTTSSSSSFQSDEWKRLVAMINLKLNIANFIIEATRLYGRKTNTGKIPFPIFLKNWSFSIWRKLERCYMYEVYTYAVNIIYILSEQTIKHSEDMF